MSVWLAVSGCGGKSSKSGTEKAKAQQQGGQKSVIDQELKKQYQMYREMRQYQLNQQEKAEQEAKKKEQQSEKEAKAGGKEGKKGGKEGKKNETSKKEKKSGNEQKKKKDMSGSGS